MVSILRHVTTRHTSRHTIRLLLSCNVISQKDVLIKRQQHTPPQPIWSRKATEQQIQIHGEASDREAVPPKPMDENPTKEWVVASFSRRLMAALIDVVIVVGAMGMSWYLRVVAGSFMSREVADSTAWYAPPTDPPRPHHSSLQ